MAGGGGEAIGKAGNPPKTNKRGRGKVPRRINTRAGPVRVPILACLGIPVLAVCGLPVMLIIGLFRRRRGTRRRTEEEPADIEVVVEVAVMLEGCRN